MLKRAFRYSPFLGSLIVLLMLGVVWLLSRLAGAYFDWFSASVTVPYLKSDTVRIAFVMIGAFFGLILVSAVARR